MSPSAKKYGDAVLPQAVSYSGPEFRDGQLTSPRYFRAADGALVVWVNAANQESVDIRGGSFALYTGVRGEYTPTVKES